MQNGRGGCHATVPHMAVLSDQPAEAPMKATPPVRPETGAGLHPFLLEAAVPRSAAGSDWDWDSRAALPLHPFLCAASPAAATTHQLHAFLCAP